MILNDFILNQEEVTLVGYFEYGTSPNNTGWDGEPGEVTFIEFVHNSNNYILRICENTDDGYRNSLGEVGFVDNNHEEYDANKLVYLPPAKVIIRHQDGSTKDWYFLQDKEGTIWF